MNHQEGSRAFSTSVRYILDILFCRDILILYVSILILDIFFQFVIYKTFVLSSENFSNIFWEYYGLQWYECTLSVGVR